MINKRNQTEGDSINIEEIDKIKFFFNQIKLCIDDTLILFLMGLKHLPLSVLSIQSILHISDNPTHFVSSHKIYAFWTTKNGPQAQK